MKIVVQIIAVFILCIIGLIVIGFVLRLLGLLFSILFGILMLAGLVYLINFLFKISVKNEIQENSSVFKVSDYNRKTVLLFSKEPTLKELLSGSETDSLKIENDTEVIVIDDQTNKEAVKVKIGAGKHQGQSGWVCRTVLQKTERPMISDSEAGS